MSWRRLAALVVVVAMAFGGLSAGPAQAANSYRLTIFFTKTISLYKSSDVRVLGLPAGKVTDVKVEGTHVRVTVRIKGSVPVPADVRATIVPLSLIGERYVQLFPVWTNGQPRARNGDVVPLERTDVPVEPDEALAALKHLLDTLDPDAAGRLVKNTAADLSGNGQLLNDTLAGVSDLVSTISDKDVQLANIIDHFDQFTATLRTREVQLGRTMDLFAQTTGLLANERRTIESLVGNLSSLAVNALDLVSVHRTRLDKDLTVLTRTLQAVKANLDSVEKVLDAGPLLVKGTEAAYDPNYHRIDLRTQFSPTVAQLTGIVGVPIVCVPVDVNCQPAAPSSGAGAAASVATPSPAAPATTAGPAATATAPPGAGAAPTPARQDPIDAIVGLLGGGHREQVGAITPTGAERAEDLVSRFGRFLRRASRLFLSGRAP